MKLLNRPILPDQPIPVEGYKHPQWVKVLAFRPPRKGELYLSGSPVQGWEAPNDLECVYWVVEALKPAPIHLHQYDISFGPSH